MCARMLVEGTILAKQEEVRPNIQKVYRYWDSGKEVHITFPLGTDVHVCIEGRTHFKGAQCPSQPVSRRRGYDSAAGRYR